MLRLAKQCVWSERSLDTERADCSVRVAFFPLVHSRLINGLQGAWRDLYDIRFRIHFGSDASMTCVTRLQSIRNTKHKTAAW